MWSFVKILHFYYILILMRFLIRIKIVLDPEKLCSYHEIQISNIVIIFDLTLLGLSRI